MGLWLPPKAFPGVCRLEKTGSFQKLFVYGRRIGILVFITILMLPGKPFDILPDHVGFNVDGIAGMFKPDGGQFRRMRNNVHVKTVPVAVVNGQA